MSPTLDELDLLEVVPCCGSLCLGDVVLFLPPAYEQAVAHRVIRLTRAGLVTRGDNNDLDDPWLLPPGDIVGRVVAAYRGVSRRRVRGGLAGLCLARLTRACRRLQATIFRPLRPLYERLAACGTFRSLAPAWLRPRLVVFTSGYERRPRLLLGRVVVGCYDPAARRWRIRRPFRLLVDPQLLTAVAEQRDGK